MGESTPVLCVLWGHIETIQYRNTHIVGSLRNDSIPQYSYCGVTLKRFDTAIPVLWDHFEMNRYRNTRIVGSLRNDSTP